MRTPHKIARHMHAKGPRGSKQRSTSMCTEDSDPDIESPSIQQEKWRVTFEGEVTAKSMRELWTAIRQANQDIDAHYDYFVHFGIDPWVELVLNSCGGELFPALAMMENLSRNRYKIHCIMQGEIASAAVFLGKW